ncbi:SH3 domain-containing protein [Streptomyces sp. MI02-7b]|uniref:SH3 domain-containing protein n=1 Tax=Streptomyces sp. MI02-7b TaxID=462941 RepID=UPI0029ADBFE6|nr:SH3 domain-containing protein [Streptomyces sp. MI02-7b]MDX3074875.1 SH3 domain-containing protein [Streptomyces sp. MI02-7b]
MTLHTRASKIAATAVTGALAGTLAIGTMGTAFANEIAAPGAPKAAPAPSGNTESVGAGEDLPDLSGEIASAAADGPNSALYQGRVIARIGLRVRSGPGTQFSSVGVLPYNALVSIVCKTNGQDIGGNPRWYRLAQNLYAWSAGRYIANVGASPRVCNASELSGGGGVGGIGGGGIGGIGGIGGGGIGGIGGGGIGGGGGGCYGGGGGGRDDGRGGGGGGRGGEGGGRDGNYGGSGGRGGEGGGRGGEGGGRGGEGGRGR